MVFQKQQVFLLMLSAGTFIIFAEFLRGGLLEASKPGLYPATFGFFLEKIGAYFDLWAAGKSSLFSAPAPIEVLFIAILTGTTYRLLCQIPSKTEIPPAFHQA